MRRHDRYAIDPARLGGATRGTPTAEALRLLVVDDHALVRHGLTLALKARFPDATLLEAGSLGDALKCVRSAEALSAVFYDLHMPDADGLPGVEAMLEALEGVPLVVVSGSMDTGSVNACIRAGARGFLPKGCNPEVLDQALPIILGGGIYAPLPPAGASAAPMPAPAAPQNTPSPAMEGLTQRQREVLRLLLQGQSNKEIARSLGVLEGTVKVHLRTVMMRLGVRNRTQLALYAARSGMGAQG